MLVLRKLELQDEKAFQVARSRWIEDPGFVFARDYVEGMPFADFVDLLRAQERGEKLPPGFVPCSSIYAFLGEEIAGRVAVRHRLNDFLLRSGGHIGYGVIPKFRRQGVATALLRAGLAEARRVGVDRVLVTCEEGNAGSRRTIEKCGGAYENTLAMEDGRQMQRYWFERESESRA